LTADFAKYRIIILGDNDCTSVSAVAPAVANVSTWSKAVDGNIAMNGTDPVFHGKTPVTQKSIAFAADRAGRTGLYVSLSCYYHGTAALTPVPVLAGFGKFTVTGVGCFNDSHIVATHPALAGLTDADLSNWSCSVHEAFDTYPKAFTVLAIAKNATGVQYHAADGTVGIPYILARGEGLSASNIQLSPPTATHTVGDPASLTVSTTSGGVALGAQKVTCTASAGPNAGKKILGTTAADGKVTLTYTSATAGTDTWSCTFIDAAERTETSNTSTVVWAAKVVVEGTTTTTVAPTTTVATSPVSVAELPRTGSRGSTSLSILGLSMLAVGGALLGGRRRRTAR